MPIIIEKGSSSQSANSGSNGKKLENANAPSDCDQSKTTAFYKTGAELAAEMTDILDFKVYRVSKPHFVDGTTTVTLIGGDLFYDKDLTTAKTVVASKKLSDDGSSEKVVEKKTKPPTLLQKLRAHKYTTRKEIRSGQKLFWKKIQADDERIKMMKAGQSISSQITTPTSDEIFTWAINYVSNNEDSLIDLVIELDERIKAFEASMVPSEGRIRSKTPTESSKYSRKYHATAGSNTFGETGAGTVIDHVSGKMHASKTVSLAQQLEQMKTAGTDSFLKSIVVKPPFPPSSTAPHGMKSPDNRRTTVNNNGNNIVSVTSLNTTSTGMSNNNNNGSNNNSAMLSPGEPRHGRASTITTNATNPTKPTGGKRSSVSTASRTHRNLVSRTSSTASTSSTTSPTTQPTLEIPPRILESTSMSWKGFGSQDAGMIPETTEDNLVQASLDPRNLSTSFDEVVLLPEDEMIEEYQRGASIDLDQEHPAASTEPQEPEDGGELAQLSMISETADSVHTNHTNLSASQHHPHPPAPLTSHSTANPPTTGNNSNRPSRRPSMIKTTKDKDNKDLNNNNHNATTATSATPNKAKEPMRKKSSPSTRSRRHHSLAATGATNVKYSNAKTATMATASGDKQPGVDLSAEETIQLMRDQQKAFLKTMGYTLNLFRQANEHQAHLQQQNKRNISKAYKHGHQLYDNCFTEFRHAETLASAFVTEITDEKEFTRAECMDIQMRLMNGESGIALLQPHRHDNPSRIPTANSTTEQTTETTTTSQSAPTSPHSSRSASPFSSTRPNSLRPSSSTNGSNPSTNDILATIANKLTSTVSDFAGNGNTVLTDFTNLRHLTKEYINVEQLSRLYITKWYIVMLHKIRDYMKRMNNTIPYCLCKYVIVFQYVLQMNYLVTTTMFYALLLNEVITMKDDFRKNIVQQIHDIIREGLHIVPEDFMKFLESHELAIPSELLNIVRNNGNGNGATTTLTTSSMHGNSFHNSVRERKLVESPIRSSQKPLLAPATSTSQEATVSTHVHSMIRIVSTEEFIPHVDDVPILTVHDPLTTSMKYTSAPNKISLKKSVTIQDVTIPEENKEGVLEFQGENILPKLMDGARNEDGIV